MQGFWIVSGFSFYFWFSSFLDQPTHPPILSCIIMYCYVVHVSHMTRHPFPVRLVCSVRKKKGSIFFLPPFHPPPSLAAELRTWLTGFSGSLRAKRAENDRPGFTNSVSCVVSCCSCSCSRSCNACPGLPLQCSSLFCFVLVFWSLGLSFLLPPCHCIACMHHAPHSTSEYTTVRTYLLRHCWKRRKTKER